MIALTTMAIVKLVDIPHITKQTIVLNRPVNMTGFRPNLSDAFPHGTAAILCAIENTAPVRPAHLATSFFSTPKLCIISGRYGKTEVRAKGSANLATARAVVSSEVFKSGSGTWGWGEGVSNCWCFCCRRCLSRRCALVNSHAASFCQRLSPYGVVVPT